MTTVSTTVTICIPDEGMTLEVLEAAISTQVQQAARELLLGACQAMETAMETEHLNSQQPGTQRNKKRPLHLFTRFGWIRLSR